MQVKYLSDVGLLVGDIGIATAIQAVVGYNHHLKHMIVKSQRHLIKSTYVFVQCRNGEDIRVAAKIRCQAEIGSVVTHRGCQPERPILTAVGPLVAHKPLTGSESLHDRTGRIEFVLIRCEMLLPLSARKHLQAMRCGPYRDNPKSGID